MVSTLAQTVDFVEMGRAIYDNSKKPANDLKVDAPATNNPNHFDIYVDMHVGPFGSKCHSTGPLYTSNPVALTLSQDNQGSIYLTYKPTGLYEQTFRAEKNGTVWQKVYWENGRCKHTGEHWKKLNSTPKIATPQTFGTFMLALDKAFYECYKDNQDAGQRLSEHQKKIVDNFFRVLLKFE